MNLSAKSGNFLLLRNSVCDCGGRVFPLVVARFSFGEVQRTTTINFSSSQNCILQTERMGEWRGRTQKFALYSFPTDIKCFPSAEANDLFPLLILWTQDCGFPSSYFRILYSLINFQIFPQQTKGCRPGRNTRRILATRVALCTNLRPHLPTVATSSDKLSTRQQAYHSSHHPITR